MTPAQRQWAAEKAGILYALAEQLGDQSSNLSEMCESMDDSDQQAAMYRVRSLVKAAFSVALVAYNQLDELGK